MSRPLPSALALLALAGAASAQSFNLDVGETASFGLPTNAYGAAANQPGFWNAIFGGPPYAFTLNDLAGNPTAVTTSVLRYGNGLGDFSADIPGTTGDVQGLLDDCEDVGSGTSIAFWTFQGLQNGFYDVYTYSIAPDDSTFLTNVTPGGTNQTQTSGGPYPGALQLGVTHTLHCVEVTDGTLVMEVQAANGFGSCNGFQLVLTTGPCGAGTGTIFCSCDAGSAFPLGVCGNPGDVDKGCGNGTFLGGAQLTATGTTSPDSIVLNVTDATPNQPGLFFQGTNQPGGGNGLIFGDGLRCAGGGVARLQVRVANASGQVSSTVSISAEGGVGPGAGPRYYQFWYRDPNLSPCGGGFNLTNGLELVW